MTKLQFGMIGVGARGRALARAALLTGDVSITAFADPWPASRAAFGELVSLARGYERAEDLLAQPGLDAVIVATPNDRHTDVVLAALDAGLHVLCEKPLAPSLEEIDRIGAAVARAGTVFQVGMELRYAPLFQGLHSMVASGRIGAPKMLWCHEFRPPFKPGVGGWRLTRAGSGGTLLEKNCHHFDLFNWLSDARPMRVMAMGSRDTIYAERDIHDRAWVMVEYANGVQASLGLALFYDRQEQLELGVLGSGGKLSCRVPPEQLVLDTPTGRSISNYPRGVDFAHGGEVEQQHAFIHSIRTGAPPLADLDAARWSHAISLAAQAAIETGQPVPVH